MPRREGGAPSPVTQKKRCTSPCIFFICMPLHVEAAAADELPHQRVAGDDRLVLDLAEILEDLDEAVCDKVLRVGGFDLHEGRHRLLFEHAELVAEAGIEHVIRRLLVGVDPAEFAVAHRLPHIDRGGGGAIPEVHIADDAADGPRVRDGEGGGYPY